MLGDIAGARWRAQRRKPCADGEAEDSKGGGHRKRAAVEPRATPKWHDGRGRGGGRLRRGSRWSGPRQRRDTIGEHLRGRFTWRVTTNGVAQRREAPILGGERRIVAHLTLELERAHGVQFAVKRRVKPEKTLVDVAVGHASVLVMARTSRSWRAWRARARAATSPCRPASRSLRRFHD